LTLDAIEFSSGGLKTTMQTTERRTNWAGNLEYRAQRLVAPGSLVEAQDVVRSSNELRVVGSRHCFNDIADTEGVHLSLERMNRVLAVDETLRRVTVEGGVRYGELGVFLHERGFALHNLASLPHISVAGACATATHGSGALGNLAVAVAEIEFIDGNGELRTFSREQDGDTFMGTVVNLGALGVVSKLTLDLQPSFHMRQDVFRELPMATLEARFEEVMRSGYSVSVFTSWQHDFAEQVWVKSKVREDGRSSAPEFPFGARAATENMHPIGGLDAINCTEQMGVTGPAYDRLPHFRMGFTPASGEELQVEYFVPRDRAVEAIRALRQQGGRLADVMLMGEIRTIKADDLWLSPCYKTSCVAFHFSLKRDWPKLRSILPFIEEALSPLLAKPHWGKMFTVAPQKIREAYPRLDDFKRLQKTLDPSGKFRNAFVDRYLV
jgi:alditol oxidase